MIKANMLSKDQSDDRGEVGPNYSVPALEKGLDVLEYLADQGIPMTQSQLARALDRGPSELFRTLTTLDRRSYIQRDPVSGAYSLTLRLYELSRTHSPFEVLVRAATEPMRALADELRESPHLSVIHHGHLLVLAQAESPALVRISVAIGGRFSLLNTVSGRVLLAHHQPAQVEAILQLTDEYGAWSLDQRAALGERLARIRMQGYDYASGEINDGVHDLGVLVGTERSQIQAALTIPSLARHPEAFLDATLPALQRCAETITQAAGIIR